MKNALVLLEKPWRGHDYLVITDYQSWQKISSRLELENDLSTDALYPARFAPYFENLGSYALAGHSSDLKKDSLLSLDVGLIVAGHNFGIGSSRVHAVRALLDAGVEMVVATSFYPVFRKNAINAGLKISSDLTLVDSYLKGEKINFSQLGLTALEQSILVKGDWLSYLQSLTDKKVAVRAFNQHLLSDQPTKAPQTMIEKYLAQAAHLPAVKPGDEVLLNLNQALIGSYDIYGALIKKIIDQHPHQKKHLPHSEQVIATTCHLTPQKNKRVARLKKQWQDFALQQGFNYYWYGQGVCHSVIETQAELGQLVVFTDSHTPHIGWLGCGLSIGADDMAGALMYRQTLVKVPATTKITFTGRVASGVDLRDIAMYILGLKLPEGTVLEYHQADNLPGSPDEWAILTNIAVEARSVSAVIVPGERLKKYLAKTRNYSPEQWAKQAVLPDDQASYTTEIVIDLAQITPMLAQPAKPQNVVPVTQFVAEHEPVKIQKVWIGSCVGGSYRNLDQALAILSQNQLAPKVKVYLQPNSLSSYIAILQKWGDWLDQQKQVKLLEACCGACMGEGEGAVKTDEVMISTATRNLAGRNSPGSKIYLASSTTCAWSAVVGMITERRS